MPARTAGAAATEDRTGAAESDGQACGSGVDGQVDPRGAVDLGPFGLRDVVRLLGNLRWKISSVSGLLGGLAYVRQAQVAMRVVLPGSDHGDPGRLPHRARYGYGLLTGGMSDPVHLDHDHSPVRAVSKLG